MAAFDTFIDRASQPNWNVVVFDTAPTGHTLRLLELPMDWSQQLDVKVFASVETTAADDVAKQNFAQVIGMMRDPAQSTFAYAMYPESTPMLEASCAAQELGTVGVPPSLVVANKFIRPSKPRRPLHGRGALCRRSIWRRSTSASPSRCWKSRCGPTKSRDLTYWPSSVTSSTGRRQTPPSSGSKRNWPVSR
jgi:anion-transporting  ArsA/GET3 family ATPase